MDPLIANLKDADAVRILTTIARARLRGSAPDLPPTPELQAALTEAIPSTSPATPTSEGDVARQALQLLLVEDPAKRERIAALAAGTGPEAFIDPVEAVALVSLAVIALQTSFRVERDKNGKWKVVFEHKAAPDALVKSVIQGLLGLFRKA